MKAIPAEYLPILAIRDTVVFPGISLPLRVNRPRSLAAVERALDRGWPIVLVTQKDASVDDPKPEHIHKVGTLCYLERNRGSVTEGYSLLVKGVSRFRLDSVAEGGAFLSGQGAVVDDELDVDESTRNALLQSVKTTAQEILSMLGSDVRQLQELVAGIDDLSFLLNLCAVNLDVSVAKKQEILEMTSLKARALHVLDLLQERKNNIQVQNEIRGRLTKKMGKAQRESILREQLRAIREELGEGESGPRKSDYQKKIEESGMPEDVKELALQEWRRLEEIGSGAPESHVIRNYLDLLCALPWNKSASERIDLAAARAVLDSDHYGLTKIKKRIVEHLAVMKLLQSGEKISRGAILLFVGPPGVGKTSLGQSIAKALGRKFARVSLGGSRDDSEIRGHRRTYVGAMPGRIIQGIKRAGENNPVIMLDEIDKLSYGVQGDPASALLEVLDPEQNNAFTDHYLDVPFDLSKVIFICTANTLDTIPEPLLDRMEVVELTGYTTIEKFHIASNHLVPKQLKAHGLGAKQMVIPETTLRKMIGDYTREAGVRSLERVIASVCRASAEKILVPDAKLPLEIKVEDLEEILGPQRFFHEVVDREIPPGTAVGLAWTPVGGEILFVESTLMPGSGRLLLTGQLGEVMKESAQIAWSVLRSRLPAAMAGDKGNDEDVHIHVPAGAIPKDGPSAGIAIAVALASLYLGKSIDPKLAMTGEISLRGLVMPVGGIKEKVIAAHRAGIQRVILAKENEKDLRDVPDEVKSQLKFDFAENISDVFELVFGPTWNKTQADSASAADVA